MCTRVYFVRHAKPDLSSKSEIRPLSCKGIKDSKKVTQAFKSKDVSAIYSSPYPRAIETIKDFATSQGFEIILVDDFKERTVGEWVEDFTSFTQKQWDDFNYKLSGGESLSEVQDRNISALLRVIQENLGRNIVIGTHGTALSTIINYFYPNFGYDWFMSIIEKMPFIICLVFEGLTFSAMYEVEI